MLCTSPYMNGFIPCPCGQCNPCRINRRRVWQHRIMLESFLHRDSCFLTLTYSDDKVPTGNSLWPIDLQRFLKRLRKEFPSGTIRFFGVGEYGDKTQRPHYHLALFGIRCLGPITTPDTGRACFCDNCNLIRSVWGFGNILVDDLNSGTAQYIAGYVVKKMTSRDDKRLNGRWPEFMRCSNKPGIARFAVDKILESMVASDGKVYLPTGNVPQSLTIDGKSLPLGRYITNKMRQGLVTDVDLCEVNKQRFVYEMQELWAAACANSSETPLSIKHVLLDKYRGKHALMESQSNLYHKEKLL